MGELCPALFTDIEIYVQGGKCMEYPGEHSCIRVIMGLCVLLTYVAGQTAYMIC